jgi:hypothetical protein
LLEQVHEGQIEVEDSVKEVGEPTSGWPKKLDEVPDETERMNGSDGKQPPGP